MRISQSLSRILTGINNARDLLSGKFLFLVLMQSSTHNVVEISKYAILKGTIVENALEQKRVNFGDMGSYKELQHSVVSLFDFSQ